MPCVAKGCIVLQLLSSGAVIQQPAAAVCESQPQDLDSLASEVDTSDMNGDEFRRLRLASGCTQESAAAILQVSPRTVARWEAGKAAPNSLEAESIRRRLARRIDGENRPRRDVKTA